MHPFKKFLLWGYTAGALLMMIPSAFSQSALSPEDEAYLRQLAGQTWAYLAAHTNPVTALPTDSQAPGGKTNTTNIGLYLSCLGPAAEMGFIPKEKAVEEARKIIASVKELPSKYGFIPNWVPVQGKTQIEAGVMAVSDFNKLPTGLILVRQYFPELAKDAAPLLERIEWQKLYTRETKSAHYGYDLLNDKPVGEGTLWLAGDVRLAAFFMIASGAADPEFWARLDRPKISAYGLEFFGPGYEWGGIFMQAMDGIFMEDRGTEMGRSIANFAWHQMRFGASRKFPVWGWSSCNIPQRGYTEGGFLPERVVAPYASALVIDYYPRHVIKNFRAFESLGTREPLKPGDPAYGFRDSVDLLNQITDKRYLALDQAMIFLPLANFLENGTVRRHFAADPFVQNGLKLIGLSPAASAGPDPRDESDPEPFPQSAPPDLVLDFKNPDSVSKVQIETEGSGFADAKITAEGLKIEFDLGNKAAGEADVILKLPPFDAGLLSEIVITLAGKRTDGDRGAFGGIRILLRDDQVQGQYGFIAGVREEMKDFSLPGKNRYGIFANPGKVGNFRFKFWGKPWFYTYQRTAASTGEVTVEKITFRFNPAQT